MATSAEFRRQLKRCKAMTTEDLETLRAMLKKEIPAAQSLLDAACKVLKDRHAKPKNRGTTDHGQSGSNRKEQQA